MSNPKAPTTKTLFIVTLLASAIVASLAAYVKFAPADRVPENQRRTEMSSAKKPPQPGIEVKVNDRKHGEVLVFTPRFEGENLRFTAEPKAVPSDLKPEVFAVQAFLDASKVTENAVRVLNVDIKFGVAVISFNAAFQAGYGSEDEHILLEGIRRAVGQFPGAKFVEFYIDGTRIDTLGHSDLSEPLPVIRVTTTDEAPKSPGPS